MAQGNLFTKQKQTQAHRGQACGCQGDGGVGGGMDRKPGVSRCKLLHLERMNNGVLLHSTGHDSQSPGIYRDAKEYKKCVYICINESLCCTAEFGTTL